jgi:integrase/recombinase XerC
MKQPQPYYRKQTKSWYVSIDRKQIPLGKGPPTTPPAEVWEKYHALMADRQPVTTETPVPEMIGRFLTWCEQHREKGTYDWYVQHLTKFVEFIGPKLTIERLKPHHVTDWLDKCYPKSGDTYRNGAVRAIMRVFNWGSKQGYIEKNPVRGVERPAATGRIAYFSPDEWQAIMGAVEDSDPFKDFLVFMKKTGCRPQEARKIEGRHFDPRNKRIAFLAKESKGKKVPRVIPLSKTMFALIRRLALKYPEGMLFRNVDGVAWKKAAVNCRCTRLTQKLGFRVFAYAIRHTYITDALLRGIDPITLAHIVGHKDANMILKVYQHMSLNTGHVERAVNKAADENDDNDGDLTLVRA